MPEQDKFSQDEWFSVLSAPFSAGALVMANAPSGLTGLVAETQAMLRATLELSEGSSSAFVQEIAAALKPGGEPGLRQRRQYKSIQEAKEGLFNGLRQVAFLVDSRVAPDEARAYKALLLGVAQRVAEAALEGGVFGIGGVRVSKAEQETLEELKGLLGF